MADSRKFDLVVFDMAGTTVNDGDAVHHSLQGALLSIAGCNVSRDAVNAVMGIQKPVAIRSLLRDSTGSAPDESLVDRVHDDFVNRMLTYYRTDPTIREIDGVTNLFKYLKSQGIRVGIDTGFNRPIAQAIIDRLGWERAGLIDASATADEVVAGRPAPFMIYRLMELTGVHDAGRVIKVGDTPSDLNEGTNARCGMVVGVTEGSHTADELRPHPHHHLIPTVRDLPKLIENSGVASHRLRLFTPGPLNTSDATKRAMLRDIGAWDDELITLTAAIRGELIELAGLTKQDGYDAVLMQGSGTFGVESVIGSLVPPGGRLLVAANGAYGERIAAMAKKLEIDTTVVRSTEHEPILPGDISAAMQGQKFDAVAVVHCETTTGVLNPMEQIGQVVKNNGSRYIVDAMSSFAGMVIDFKSAGIDALISSANKCVEGVPGVSFALVKRDWLSSAAGWALSLDLVDQWKGLEDHGRFRYTPPTHVLLALHMALEELRDSGGVPARAKRYRDNHRTLISGMTALGISTIVKPDYQSPFITTFLDPTDPAFDFSQFYKRLRDRGFIIYFGKLTATKCFRQSLESSCAV
jgi:2-aminoethylphosphonate-pyruvate transaminase